MSAETDRAVRKQASELMSVALHSLRTLAGFAQFMREEAGFGTMCFDPITKEQRESLKEVVQAI